MKKIIASIVVLFPVLASAQDLQQIAQGDLLKVNGNLGYNQMYTFGSGRELSRKPFVHVMEGSLNMRILGTVDAPWTFRFSNLGNAFTQPTFNQQSVHPSYKWIAVHAGTISANYSPYTLNGHVFSGFALDLKPGRFSSGFFRGRFRKEILPEGPVANSDAAITRRRDGWGFKTQWRSKQSVFAGFSFIRMADDSTSFRGLAAAPLPQSNTALSLDGGFRLLKSIQLRLNYGISAYTHSTRAPGTSVSWMKYIPGTNSSTAGYEALRMGADWQRRSTRIGMQYERVGPGYRTMGAYYFNNDLENIQVNGGTALLKGRMDVRASLGLQRNNLDESRPGRMHRWVGMAQLQYRPNNRWNCQFGWSDFLTYTHVRSFTDIQLAGNPWQNWDTLNFRQISRSVNGSLFRSLGGNAQLQRSLNGGFTWQTGADRRNGQLQGKTALLNAFLSLQLLRPLRGSSMNLSFNAGRNALGADMYTHLCPVLGWSRKGWKGKGRWMASAAYNTSLGAASSAQTLVLRLLSEWTVAKQHRFALSANAQQGRLPGRSAGFTECTVLLSYNSSLNWDALKRK